MNLGRSLIIMMNDSNAEIVVDERKVKKILRRIIVEESKNLKSQEKSDTQMVKLIKDLIEEEVECY